MSKLANLRGNSTNTEAAIFSNNVDASTSAIFARFQGKKTPQQNRTSTKRKYTPSRFRVAKGETKSMLILDEQFTFAMREHNHKDAQGRWQTIRCIADFDSCPVCALPDHRPHDVVLLTVLDLTPWSKVDEKTGKEVTYEFTKRVLALKSGDYKTMKAVASTSGNLRGLLLDMTRGYGEKESANGVPTFVNKLTEEQLIEMFGSPEKKYDSGFVLPANNAIIPFDYASIFVAPSRAELADELGLAPRPGSKEELKEDETPPWEEVEVLDLGEELPDVE